VSRSATDVVLDHTALLLLGRGHPFLSGLVAAPAHRSTDRHVFVPALCLAAAVAERPAVGDHVLSLPAIEVVGLEAVDALAVGRLVAGEIPWQHCHAVAACQPDAEWPDGRPLVTAEPHTYGGQRIAVIHVD